MGNRGDAVVIPKGAYGLKAISAKMSPKRAGEQPVPPIVNLLSLFVDLSQYSEHAEPVTAEITQVHTKAGTPNL